jgi:50S ribosomal subunit-associated GTPase HflX
MLLGNKIDIEPMEIDELTSKSFSKAHEFDLHYQISCKSNSGINEAFEQLATALHQPKSSGTTSQNNRGGGNVVDLEAKPLEQAQQESKCSC